MGDAFTSCPFCAEKIRQDAIMCRFCHKGLSLRHYRHCPFCYEMVRINARKCRYCKMSIFDPPSPPGRPPQGSPLPKPRGPGPQAAEIVLPKPESEAELDLLQRKPAPKIKFIGKIGKTKKTDKKDQP